jgi:hypothetical protein
MIRLEVILLMISASTLGAAFTWDGSSDTLVTTDANWSGNSDPTKNGDIIFNTPTNTLVQWDFNNGATSEIGDMTFTSAAGPFTISSDGGGTLKIGNVDNQSSSLQIFDISLEFQNKETVLAGGPVQFNQAILTKTGNSQLTFSGGSQIIAGASNIFDSSIDLILNDTTLNMNNTSQSFSSITVSGDSILDFGGSSAAINISNLSISSGTLTIKNWTGESGDFQVTNAVDSTSITNIQFEGWGDATWDNGVGVTPGAVPEPATYGALLMGFSSGLLLLRRRRHGR